MRFQGVGYLPRRIGGDGWALGRRMRILYHHRTLGDGAEGIHVREMVQAFRRLGHQVKVIGPIGETNPQQLRRSKLLDALKRLLPTVIYELLELGYSAYAYLKTLREIRSFR